MLERLVIAVGGPPASCAATDVAAEFPTVAIIAEPGGAPASGRTVTAASQPAA